MLAAQLSPIRHFLIAILAAAHHIVTQRTNSFNRVYNMNDTKQKILNIKRLFNHGPSPFRTCQWPFGEPGTKEFRFCGEKTLEGYSYCIKHVEMAYREPEPRRKVA